MLSLVPLTETRDLTLEDERKKESGEKRGVGEVKEGKKIT